MTFLETDFNVCSTKNRISKGLTDLDFWNYRPVKKTVDSKEMIQQTPFGWDIALICVLTLRIWCSSFEDLSWCGYSTLKVVPFHAMIRHMPQQTIKNERAKSRLPTTIFERQAGSQEQNMSMIGIDRYFSSKIHGFPIWKKNKVETHPQQIIIVLV